jgi:REP element-mobilizing transposase RayT
MYITGIVQNHEHKMLAIGATSDHIHILIGYNLNQLIPHSPSQIDPVAKYILSQEEHHRKKSFKEEYFEILEKNNVKFKEEYLFEFFSDIND